MKNVKLGTIQLTKNQQTFVDSKEVYNVLKGKVGTGKTFAGTYITLKRALENDGTHGLIYYPTTPGALGRLLASCGVVNDVVRYSSGSFRYHKLPNGSYIHVADDTSLELMMGRLCGIILNTLFIDDVGLVDKKVCNYLRTRVRNGITYVTIRDTNEESDYANPHIVDKGDTV